MTAFIKISTGQYPLHEGDIREMHPEITEDQTGDTFPTPPDFSVVERIDLPDIDHLLQKFYEGKPECVDGVWRMTWVIVDRSEEEIAQILAEREEQRLEAIRWEE
jgi:hypothetical protein